MFHISDIKKYMACPKSFWLNAHGERSPFIAYNHLEEGLSILIAKRLNAENLFIGERGMDASKSVKLCQEYEWLSKVRFEYKDLRVKIPFMHKSVEGWDVYFLSMVSHSSLDDIQYYADNCWVLEKNGLSVDNVYVIRLNGGYLYEDYLDLKQLFTLSCYVQDDPEKGTLSENVKKNIRDLTHVLEEMKRCYEALIPLSAKNKNCIRRNKCAYYDFCFQSEQELPDDSILTLSSSRYKNEMKEQGRERLKDADLTKLEGTKMQYAQIMAGKSPDGLYVDFLSLNSWLQSWNYPYSFIDFEWESYVIPPYFGLKPYCKVPFQYSLHIMDENGKIQHREFLGVHDCREEFIKHLIEDFPSSGSIIAFNADGAEKLRLLELAEQFPQYADKLHDFCDRMIDLSIPFQNGTVYDLRMRGYSSLKVLLPICDPDLTYQNLEIHDGMMAVDAWRHLCENKGDQEKIREDLLSYCGLDSYSMIVVYDWLVEQLQKEEKNESF